MPDWIGDGVNGVRLEAYRIGRLWYTTDATVAAFPAALNGGRGGAKVA